MTTLRRNLCLVALLLALALAAYAQHSIAYAGHWTDGWPLLSSFDSKLTELYRVEQSVAIAIVVFTLAMAVFAWAVRDRSANRPIEATGARRHAPSPGARELLTLAAFTFPALVAWTYMVVRLWNNHYEGWYVSLFFAVLAVVAGAGGLLDRGLRSERGLRASELAFLLATTGLLAGLVLTDLTNWRYATTGDDGAFYLIARDIVQDGSGFNLFGQFGPSGNHPVLSSAYQAAVMEVFGVDVFGWRLATALLVFASIPVFYLLLRELMHPRVALLGTLVLAPSHYLLGYAHTGYDNLFAIFPTLLALLLFVAGVRKSSVLLMYGAGVAAGLGFYTFYSARAAIVTIALALLLQGRSHWRAGNILPLALGFVLAVTPIFALEGWDVISEMRAESQAGNTSMAGTMSRLAESAPRAFLAFNFNPYPKHFVSGSLLDDVSAPLALLGLAYAATRVRDAGHRLLVIWFLVAITASGLFHPRQEEINSRLHFVLPPMAAFAGIALDRSIDAFAGTIGHSRLRPALSAAGAAAVLFTVLGLNLYRHWEVSPERITVSGPAMDAAIALREVQRPACDVSATRNAVFAENPFPLMPLIFDIYGWQGKEPLLFYYDDPRGVYAPSIAGEAIACVVIVRPNAIAADNVVQYVVDLSQRTGVPVQTRLDPLGRPGALVLPLGPPPQ
jgi:4-amino-4-deoxy-L-arabinose transferase-like glycosyltransferase